MTNFRKDLVILTFSSIDTIPETFRVFIEELQRIQEGNIDPIAFNKRKKQVNELLASWIELSGGMMFSRLLFEFQEEFYSFSESLYRDILTLEKRQSEKQKKQIKNKVQKYFVKLSRFNRPLSEVFMISLCFEAEIAEKFVGKVVPKKDSWNKTKEIFGIDSKFEKYVEESDKEIEDWRNFMQFMNEKYVMTPNGPLLRSQFKELIAPIEKHYKRKR